MAAKIDQLKPKVAMTVREHVDKYFGGSPMAFATANLISRQQANRWIKSGYMIIDGKLYSERRTIK
jgi:hypothetical protein